MRYDRQMLPLAESLKYRISICPLQIWGKLHPRQIGDVTWDVRWTTELKRVVSPAKSYARAQARINQWTFRGALLSTTRLSGYNPGIDYQQQA